MTPSNTSSHEPGEVPLISDEVMVYLRPTMFGIVIATSFFGLVTNCINVLVFAKQGFREHLNISLCALAVSDFLMLVFVIFSCIFRLLDLYSTVKSIDFIFIDIQGLSWVRDWFYIISILITVYITVERCLLVVMPLTFRMIVSSKKTFIVVTLIYVAVTVVYSQVFRVQRLRWVWDPALNQTRFTLYDTGEYRYTEEYLDSLSTVIIVTAQIVVTIATFLLVRGLSLSSKFRQTAKTSAGQNESDNPHSRKMVALAQLVRFVALLFIASNIPVIVSIFTFKSLPNYGLTRRHFNMISLIFNCARLSSAISSSINIFVYFRLSTGFRSTLRNTFGIKKEKDSS